MSGKPGVTTRRESTGKPRNDNREFSPMEIEYSGMQGNSEEIDAISFATRRSSVRSRYAPFRNSMVSRALRG